MNRLDRFTLYTAAWAIAAVGLVSCGGSSAPGTTPPGPVGPAVPTAGALIVSSNPLIVQNNPDTEADVTVTAITTNGQAVSGVPVTLTSSDGVVITPGGATTDTSGTVRVKARLLSRANRAVTIRATAGSTVGTGSFVVQGAKLAAQVETPRPAVGAQARIRFTLTDSSNNPMPGESLRISSSLGSFQPITATTDAAGTYLLQYSANVAGIDTITAEGAGTKPLVDPKVEVGAAAFPPPSATPAAFSLQAQPATVDFNPSGSANRAQLIARVFDASNVPVQNAQVQFRIAAGPQFGTLASTDVVLTDAGGFARTDFIPGSAGSAQDQIKVCAVVVNATAAPSNPLPGFCNPDESGTALTVRETPVSIVIGQSGVILVPDDLQYRYQFLVQVARVGGAPVQGAVVTVDPLEHAVFFKGTYRPLTGTMRARRVTATCRNEDLNRNDILEPGEDVNVNAQLDPRRPVNFRFVGANGATTNEFGQVIVEIIYPKSFGTWLSLDLFARVTVGGSESRASNSLPTLLVAVNEITGTGDPAFIDSPFGVEGAASTVNPPGPAGFSPGCNNPL